VDGFSSIPTFLSLSLCMPFDRPPSCGLFYCVMLVGTTRVTACAFRVPATFGGLS